MMILLTGATGYIGSNLLIKLLATGYDVSTLNLKGTSFPFRINDKSRLTEFVYDGSIESIEKAFKIKKYDMVIHLAARVLTDHRKTDIDNLINSNILFGTQLLEVMKLFGAKKIINTGTYWQHYNDDIYNPVCLYAATKQSFEDILKYYCEAEGINSITLELTDNYGPNDPRNKVLNLLIKIAKSREVLNMTEGDQLISLVYIDDITDAYLISANMLLNNDVIFEKYSIRSNENITIRQLVDIFENILGEKLNINWGARQYPKRFMDSPYLQLPILPGWEPIIGVEKGIKNCL